MTKVSIAFEAVRPGDVYPSTIPVGEEVSGRLAEIAAALGALHAASVTKPPSNRAAKRAPETKA